MTEDLASPRDHATENEVKPQSVRDLSVAMKQGLKLRYKKGFRYND